MNYAERIQKAAAEKDNFLRNEMSAWGTHPLLWHFTPLESVVDSDPERQRIKRHFEQKRRDYLEAAREYGTAIGPYYQLGLQLDPVHVRNCKMFASRHQMLAALPKNAIVGEVGTHMGAFAKAIIAANTPQKLHLLDWDFSAFEYPAFQEAIDSGAVEIHGGDSANALSSFPSDYFDWLYIDADHTYEGVSRDIKAAVRTVKPEGLLVFNDYTYWSQTESEAYGVAAAVHELCIFDGWEMLAFALSPRGYHDVAIRRIPNYRNLEF